MPMGVPHGYFNKSDKPVRALWVSPMGKLKDLFEALHDLQKSRSTRFSCPPVFGEV